MPNDKSKIILFHPDGHLVEVSREGNRFRSYTQGAGFGVGYVVGLGFALVREATEGLGNTELGCGVRHGFQAAGITVETATQRYKLGKAGEETERAFADDMNIEYKGKETRKTIARALVLGVDTKRPNPRYKCFIEPMVVVRSTERAQTRTQTQPAAQPASTHQVEGSFIPAF